MSQPVSYTSFNEGTSSRRFTGFPLNSTLVSSYTPDTIRSIISQAAAGQPYSTAVWIRLNRAGIQVSAQDAQIARTRIPVFIPIGLTHDIFMLPTVNNVICIVYDEIQSNMKGVLLYVVHPSDAQAIREEFRIAKQTNNGQQSSPVDSRYNNPNEVFRSENTPVYSPLSSRSPLFNRQTIRQPSPRRLVYIRDYDNHGKRDITPTLPQIGYNSNKSGDYRRHRRNRSGQSPSKRSTDSVEKKERKNASRSPDKRTRAKLEVSRSSPDLSREQIQEEQQRKQQELLVQQQLYLQQQQQRMANWQPGQQAPLIPVGIYNRYVPKTIPLPTGETLKTTLPPAGVAVPEMNGTTLAYVEPILPNNGQRSTNSRSRSRSISPPSQQQKPERSPMGSSTPSQSRRQHSSQPSRIRPRDSPAMNPTERTDEETKQYIKMLMDEMQAMKIEMNKLRQAAVGAPKGRSDSIQVDLKEIRSHIDLIRSRMAMTPRITEK